MARFTAGELRVMQVLWENGPLTPPELQERFPEPIKNPALRSYLSILVEKGHITRHKEGKAYSYKAKTPKQKAFSTMLGDLVKTFCSGSVEELVMTLVQKEKIDVNDLLELKRLAGDSTGSEKTKPDSKQRSKRTRKKY